MSANDIQIGGTHYRNLPIQPWDFITANELGFIEGNIVKYIARWNRPGGKGLEDLRKTKHYIEKLIEIQLARQTVESDSPADRPPPKPPTRSMTEIVRGHDFKLPSQ